MRSKDPRLSVSELAGHFGGGGHHLAAGARATGDLATVRERVLALAEEAIRQKLDNPA
jgi:phosphoesterase RecJ-like protein